MWLKEMIKKTFSDENKITIERYKWAKLAFIISSFLLDTITYNHIYVTKMIQYCKFSILLISRIMAL